MLHESVGHEKTAPLLNAPASALQPSSRQASTAFVFPKRIITHHAKAGLNPLADAASYLFSMLGRLKHTAQTLRPREIQKELIQEVALFQETIQQYSYPKDCTLVACYVLCAFIDDVMPQSLEKPTDWQAYALLAHFNHDTQQEEKFFHILETITQDPATYIDLMEFMYLCLSFGFRGPFRTTQQAQYQLDQITNRLYKHIKAYRGAGTHTLSLLRQKKPPIDRKKPLLPTLILGVLITSSIIMTLFIGLGIIVNTKSTALTLHVVHHAAR